MRRLPIYVGTSLLAMTCGAGVAQDCPTKQTADRGFVVERGDKQKTEVFVGADGNVRTAMRYAGQPMLETTLFEGLFSLVRLDRGRRSTFNPLTDLKTLFPLRVGQKALAQFEYKGGDRTVPMTILLLVHGSESLDIGPCAYTVLKLEHKEARGEGAAPIYVSTDYYSPELKLVLMKEYKESDGRSTFVKFDKIYQLP